MSNPKPARPRRRRRWWQVVVRLGVLLGAAAVLLYVTLPWWLPKRYVADRIAAMLSSQLGQPVQIDRLDVSWRQGVRLEGLRIACGEEFGGGDMVVVGRLRCPFSPVQLWLRERLQWAEVTDAELRVVINEDGQVNLAVLERLKLGYPPEHLMIRRGGVTIQLPGHDRLLRLHVSDLQYRSGGLERVGRITMSAVLEQTGAHAPVTLLASAGGTAPVTAWPATAPAASGPVAASFSFSFADVDIAQLNLPLLLGLPLKRLDGRGSGRLECRVSESGIVDQFSFILGIERLDAQPRVGPELPVITHGEVALAVAYDPLTQRADIHTLRLHLPGIKLLGRGKMHADVLSGAWEGLHSLEVTGAVNPSMAAALFSRQLPGGVAFDGDVQVRVRLGADAARLSADVKLDATAAAMGAGERVIKPRNRKLAAELTGLLDKRTGKFSVDRAELSIGGNHFLGGGAVHKARQLVGEIAGGTVGMATVLRRLTELDWRGQWEITELESLRDLIGTSPLDEVALDGRILGHWQLESGGAIGLRSVRVPAGTRLSVGRWFTKPPDQPMRVELFGVIQADPPALTGARVSVAIGEFRASVDEAKLALSAGEDPAGGEVAIRANGNYSLHNAAGLLACLPLAKTWKLRAGGGLAGEFVGVLSPSFRRLHVLANATHLHVTVGEAFQKPAGQPADVAVDFRCDRRLPAAFDNTLSVQVKLSSARLDGSLQFPPAGAAEKGLRCRARLAVSDASWLLGRIPAAGALLEPWKIHGSTAISLRADISDRRVGGELLWEADDLEFALPGGSGTKARGTALRVRLSGEVASDAAAIHALSLDLGRSSIFLDGKVALAKTHVLPEARNGWPPPGVAAVDLFGRGRLVLDAAARALLPELAKQADRYGLAGGVRAELTIRGGAAGLELTGALDADDLAISIAREFRKPAGVKAQMRFQLKVPADLARLQLRDVFVDAGAFQLRGDLTCPLLGEDPLAGHVAATVPQLSRLVKLVPRLERYDPAGAAFVEAEFERRSGRGRLKYATVKVGKVTATYRGRRCLIDGAVAVEDVEPAGLGIKLGRVTTDSLEVAIGKNRLFLVADLRSPMAAPAGHVEVLATEMDMHDLQSLWEATAALAKLEPLTPVEAKALAQRAEALIAQAERLLGSADVRCRVQADRLVYLDPVVRAFYEVRSLIADAQATGGTVRTTLTCGLNGGRVRQRFVLKLRQAPQRVLCYNDFKEIMSGENMVAQLAREFPGNTFYGDFSRTENLSYGLADLVMGMLDGRHRPVPVGVATTITEDGRVRGRAAPKFVTRFFPGLNLATYHYRRMTGYAEYLPDGTARNDMIFEGVNYDLYMEGTTDTERIGRYEIGAILPRLLESPESNHRLRQGRVPILKFKARIASGRFHDEEVSYPLPPETAFIIFVRNNIVYRLLAGGRKQRTSEIIPAEPATAPTPPAGSAP